MGYSSLTVLCTALPESYTVTIIHCSGASGSANNEYTAYRRFYLSICLFVDVMVQFLQNNRGIRKTQFQKGKKQQQYIDHGSFNYSFQGNCQQMFLCVCVQSISWSVIHSQVIVRHDQRDDNIRLTRDNMADTNN